MMRATTTELKLINKRNILNFIYSQRRTAKQEISAQLQLSLPTVTNCLKELFKCGLIEKNGYFRSTGGRKADALTFVASSRIAIGVEILKGSYEILSINLYGDILKSILVPKFFCNAEDYYTQICSDILTFIHSLHIDPEKILGIGIVLQGLISSNGKEVTYGKILDCTGLTINHFTNHLPYPCSMIHDAEAAANVELWFTPSMKDAIFFHIRSNLSGAIIVDGKFLKGQELKSGVFEHMTLVPNGRPCYCGKNGCIDAYCSLRALSTTPTSDHIKIFFTDLRNGHPKAIAAWDEYLCYLSIAIDNLHMFMDSNIILGGTLAQFLTRQDIRALLLLVQKRSAFPTLREFIKISQCSTIPIAKGAAIPFVKKYLGKLIETDIE